MRVLDTDVSIEILRGSPPVLKRRRDTIDEVVSPWINAAELFYGAAKSSEASANQSLVIEFLSTLRLLGLDADSARRFGFLKAELERMGRRLADADLFIAAIVLANDAILATGNTRHYRRIPGLRLEDWIRG